MNGKIATAAILAAVFLLRDGHAGIEVSETRPAMGTLLEITLVADDTSTARQLLDEAFRETARLESILSNWSPSSEVEKFNRRVGGDWIPLSTDLERVIAIATDLSKVTKGAFDLTVDPLTRPRRQGAPLTPAGTRRRLALVGYEALECREGAARLARAGAGIDTGGIAKGYAVDRLVERLRAGGARAGFLNFGRSSMAGFGDRPWKVLTGGTSAAPGEVALRDEALSTSLAGPGGEILDPRTGLPVTRSATVTVITTSATEAECWSKALLILDERDWPALPAGLRLFNH